MNKQEAIRKAWEDWGIPYSDKYVDKNGFIDNKQELPEIVDNALLSIKYSATGHNDFDYKNNQYRPKSLQGIETNNGWIKIESEGDLPKEQVFLYSSMTDSEWIGFLFNAYGYLDKGTATHYQPITKPLKPIY